MACAGKVELVERVEAEEAGAVDGDADLVVLFEDDDVVSAGGQVRARPSSPAGPAPTMTTSCKSGPQYFRPRASHVPCKLIQNDRRINRTSSSHERLPT